VPGVFTRRVGVGIGQRHFHQGGGLADFRSGSLAVAVVRGGSYYFPQGSGWYFPNSSRLTEHGKLLLMAPCKDRAATLGFRCVMDAS
jgi:hypothetical protein